MNFRPINRGLKAAAAIGTRALDGCRHPPMKIRALIVAILGPVALFAIVMQPTATAAAQRTLTGRVVAVADGDTVTLLTPEKRQLRIRLAEIDAPEKGQPYGARAKQVLSDLCFGKTATAVYVDTDRYGRMVARLYVEGLDINAEMIRRGAAWVYRKYAKDPAMLSIETAARAAKRGIWSLPEAEGVPPWEWRGSTRSSGRRKNVHRQRSASIFGPCGVKGTCREMASCAEARFYLTFCGVSDLDGDRDGVPCESLCPHWNGAYRR